MTNVSFTARPVAVYKPFKGADQKSMTVFRLEEKDIPYLEKFKKTVKNNGFLKVENPVHQSVTLGALDSILTALKLNKKLKLDDKSVSLVAVYNNKITSIVQGNLPKVDLSENKIVRSSRGVKAETELDWLSVIPQNQGEGTAKASAPAVMAELFDFCLKLPTKINSIFVRSEVPEKCYKTVNFYEKLGFKSIGGNTKMETPDSPIDLVRFAALSKFTYSNDDIIPMVAKRADIKKTIKNIAERFDREIIKNGISVDLNDIIS